MKYNNIRPTSNFIYESTLYNESTPSNTSLLVICLYTHNTFTNVSSTHLRTGGRHRSLTESARPVLHFLSNEFMFYVLRIGQPSQITLKEQHIDTYT